MNQETTLLQKSGVFALVCIGLLALSAVWFMYKSFSQQDTRTFAVAGKGEIDVQATKATITGEFIADSENRENASEAREKLTATTKNVFVELKKIGVEEKDIKTENVSTNAKYDYCYNYAQNTRIALPEYCKTNPNDPKVIGHTASQNFTISIKDNKELVEKVLGLLPSLGARNTYGPNWEVDNETAVQQARELAVQEAKAKAEGIAKSLGMRLGEVQYYSEDQGGGQPYPVMYAKDMAVSARAEMAPAYNPVPVSEGTDKVVVNVNITYELR